MISPKFFLRSSMKLNKNETHKIIKDLYADSQLAQQGAINMNLEKIVRCVRVIVHAIKKGGKMFFFGNGGSAADSQHLAAEFIGRFQKERHAIAAIALTTDTSILTALSNDYSFDIVFSRQLQGLGCAKDVAVGLSTSGNSRNVFLGLQEAKKIGMKTISLTGHHGGKIARLTDVSLIVPSLNTARIQEAHLCLEHIICDLVERSLSGNDN